MARMTAFVSSILPCQEAFLVDAPTPTTSPHRWIQAKRTQPATAREVRCTYHEWRECLRKMDHPDLETLRAYQFRQFQTAMDVLRSLPSTLRHF